MSSLSSTGNALSASPTPDQRMGDKLLGVKSGGSDYGDRVSAALALADWDRYKSMYQPLEDLLIGMVQDPNGRQNAMNTGAQAVGRNMDNAAESFERQTRGLGLELTPGQQASYERRQDITAGLTRVGAANTSARNYDQLRRIILGGS